MQKSWFRQVAFCVLMGVACSAVAQPTQPITGETSTLPQPAPPPVAPPKTSVPSQSVIAPSGEQVDDRTSIPLMQWGPVSLRPHLTYRFIYGDGIQASPGQESKTVIQELSPGILFNLGRWNLNYTPTFTFYSSSEFRDTLGHDVNLNGNLTHEKWMFGLSQSYTYTSQPLVETGTQTDEESFVTDLFGAYHFTDELWVDFGINQTFRFAAPANSTNATSTNNFSNFNDSREWSTLNWLNYQIIAGLNVAIGGGFGYVDLEKGTDMTYEQLQGRVQWRASEKITLTANGGVEFRQFLRSTNSGIDNPIYGLSVDYTPFEHTRISLSGNQRIAVSYFDNQLTEATDFRIGLDQRLLEKLNLSLSYGYNITRYVSSASAVTTNNVSPNRRDEGSFFNVRLSCPIKQRTTLTAFFDWSENTSDQSAFAYNSTQVGLEARYQF